MRRRIHNAVRRELLQAKRGDRAVIRLTLDCGHQRHEVVRRTRLGRRLAQLDRGRPIACYECEPV